MKRLKKIILFLMISIVMGFISFKLIANRIISDAKALSIEKIDISQIDDGQYYGNYEIFPVKVTVNTWIQNGEIIQIDLMDHFNGRGRSAEIILGHIIEKQSLQVDNISGATVSSITIKKAIENSLHNK